MAKRRVGQYPKAFRKMAVERLKNCDNIVALSAELGVHRRLGSLSYRGTKRINCSCCRACRGLCRIPVVTDEAAARPALCREKFTPAVSGWLLVELRIRFR